MQSSLHTHGAHSKLLPAHIINFTQNKTKSKLQAIILVYVKFIMKCPAKFTDVLVLCPCQSHLPPR